MRRTKRWPTTQKTNSKMQKSKSLPSKVDPHCLKKAQHGQISHDAIIVGDWGAEINENILEKRRMSC